MLVMFRPMLILVMVAALAIAGCCCPSEQAREQIRIGAAVCDANLREWDALTDAQKREAQFEAARSFHVLNYAINGVEVPAEFAPASDSQPAASADDAGAAEVGGDGR